MTSLQDRTTNETLMIVEDEGPMRRFLRTFLAGSGYRLQEASTGAAALKLAAEKGYGARASRRVAVQVAASAAGIAGVSVRAKPTRLLLRAGEQRPVFLGHPHLCRLIAFRG